MTEPSNRAHCKPHYKNEVSIFEKETLQKIEEFRTARSNWVTSHSNQITNTNTSEGFYKSDVYKGRCVCLRRIGFKTTYLRVHHKSLRPLKYYTCRRKLPDIDMVRTDSLEKLVSLNDESQARMRFKRQFFLKRLGATPVKRESKETTHSCSKIGPERTQDIFQEEIIDKKKSKWGRKNKKRKEEKETKSGLSRKAIQKLKAAQLEAGVIESCKCDDGKELTVVIKGFCFCDKTSLNRLKLDKVCDEYSKLTEKEPKLPPRLTDALETPVKPTPKKVVIKKVDEEKVTENTVTLPEPDPAPETPTDNENLKVTSNVEEKSKSEDINDSTVTLFKNTVQGKSDMALTKEQFDKMKETAKKKK